MDNNMKAKLIQRIVSLTLLHGLALYFFTKGFLLTRIELPHRSKCHTNTSFTSSRTGAASFNFDSFTANDSAQLTTCWMPQTYNKAVVIIVDALRYDFVFASQAATPKPHNVDMAGLRELLSSAGSAGAAFKFVADTPTITISRLKALLTGGLPTFLDIGESFSGSRVTEDNLLWQFKDQGKRLVVMGDDTWMQLDPEAFTAAHPYPSFNVKDLHTVDDGVWEHLVPYLERPQDWDILIAHYLGMDHAGHTFGVRSSQMSEKAAQMVQQIQTVADLLLKGAYDGGPYDETLLLVFGDHGQTMGGDHGGGSAEETDSALLAFNVGKWASNIAASGNSKSAAPTATASDMQNSSPAGMPVHATVMPQIDLTPTLALLLGVPIPFGNLGKVSRELWQISAHDKVNKPTCITEAVNATPTDAQQHRASAQGSIATSSSEDAACDKNQEGNANVLDPAFLQSYVQALQLNTKQVYEYLDAYSHTATLSQQHMQHCRQLYTAAESALSSRQTCRCCHGAGGSECCTAASKTRGNDSICKTNQDGGSHSHTGDSCCSSLSCCEGCSSDHDSRSSCCHLSTAADSTCSTSKGLQDVVTAYTEFLEASAAAARSKFTQFNVGFMVAGCASMIAAVVYCGFLIYRHLVYRQQLQAVAHPEVLILAVLAVFHAFSLFGVDWIMGEGRVACYMVAVCTAVLWLGGLRQYIPGTAFTASSASTFSTPLAPSPAAPERIDHTQQQQVDAAVKKPMARGQDSSQAHESAFKYNGLPICYVVAGPLALACNVMLQRHGLIDRSGQDPHLKVQVSADAAGSQSSHGSTEGLLWTVLPSISLLLLLCWVTSCCCPRTGQPASCRQQQQNKITKLVNTAVHYMSQSCMLVSLYSCICAWWAVQFLLPKDTSCCSLLNLVPALPQLNGLQKVVVSLLCDAASVVQAVTLMPLRLLLPRGVYAITGLAIGRQLLQPVLPSVVGASLAHSMTGSNVTFFSYQTCTHPYVEALGCVLGMVSMLLGFKGPSIALLMAVQAVCLACIMLQRLQDDVSAAARNHCLPASSQPITPTNESQTWNENAEHNPQDAKIADMDQLASKPMMPVQADCRMQGVYSPLLNECMLSMWCVILAVLLYFMGLQGFFVTGHFCEFSGLQYDSAFIGFDDMEWYTGAILLTMNTFGGMIVSCIALPTFVHCLHQCALQYASVLPVQQAERKQDQCAQAGSSNGAEVMNNGTLMKRTPTASAGNGSQTPPLLDRTVQDVGHVSACAHYAPSGQVPSLCSLAASGHYLGICLYVYLFFRTLTVCTTMLNAAIQRWHIVVWAIFAPKLVFEVFFVGICDVALLLALLIWESAATGGTH